MGAADKDIFPSLFSANCPNRLSPPVFPAQVADNTMDGGPIFLIFSFLPSDTGNKALQIIKSSFPILHTTKAWESKVTGRRMSH